MSCPICLHPLLQTDEGGEDNVVIYNYKLPSSHCFHSLCVKQWLHYHISCPVCRLDLTKVMKGKDELSEECCGDVESCNENEA